MLRVLWQPLDFASHLGITENSVVEEDGEEHQSEGDDLLPSEDRVAEESLLWL